MKETLRFGKSEIGVRKISEDASVDIFSFSFFAHFSIPDLAGFERSSGFPSPPLQPSFRLGFVSFGRGGGRCSRGIEGTLSLII